MNRPKVLLTRRWPDEVEQYLAERYELTRNVEDRPLTADELREAMATHDAVCPTVSDRLDASIVDAGRGRLRILGNFGVGVSHIDLEACRRAGIVVTNTPDVLTECTADIAITLMLMVARRAGEGERHVRARAWTGWRPTHMMGTRLSGKTLGLIGFGRIGQATARKAHLGFGMQILYYSRRRAAPEIEAALGARFCPTVEELLGASDFVSLHCPGGAETRHLLDAKRLALMKPTAFLINTARGEVVDEQALAAALRSGSIAGAGLDVYEHEPRITEALFELENVVLLPHLGSATRETRVAMGMRVAENLDLFFSGRAPRDRVC
ncbi:MAG: D-glycerate dehydrogenase [Pseudomonadota bacterium]|nr:MAG: D-glycerate dehydrogenase [Pseudomonadota bacterium]